MNWETIFNFLSHELRNNFNFSSKNWDAYVNSECRMGDLTLINATNLYCYLTWGGRNHPPPPEIEFRNGLCKFCFYRGLDTYRKGLIPNVQALSFNTQPQRIFWKLDNFDKNPQKHQKSQFCYLEKSALELRRATTTKPRQIERSNN